METVNLMARDGLSYVRGDMNQSLYEETIAGMLSKTVEKYRDRPAAVFRQHGVRWTWGELQAESDALATALNSLGLKKGDRLAIWSPNRPEWLVVQFAAARLGLILVNLNPAYRLAELRYALNLSKCQAIISADVFKTSNYLEILRNLIPELDGSVPGEVQSEVVPSLRIVIRMGEQQSKGMLNYKTLIDYSRTRIDRERLDSISSEINSHDPVNIQFTSGTTGASKGATLTNYAVCNNARFSAAELKFTHQDKLCIPIPLYHAFGMILAGLVCVTSGATMVFPGEAFDPSQTLATVAQERCTAMHCVPMMLISMFDQPNFSSYDLSSLRTGMMAGAPCPIETMKRVVSDMHMEEVSIAFGMTETSGAIFQSSTTDELERRVSTVGRILPMLEAKIVGTDGSTLPIGEKGELCVRGYTVLKGYWADEERTRQAIVDGWLHTGDLATIDEHGYCSIVGRAKDMLIRGGENIYPREIEEFLFTHPQIQTVQVFGVPDSRYGEEVCAWIILKAGASVTEDDIKKYCKEQISHYKVPRYVKFVDTLPLTITGKAQKFMMRDAMIKELGL